MTHKIAFLFPGQGSQKVGMGKELTERFSWAKDIFQQADDVTGFSLSSICFEGPEERLNLTSYAQPGILTVSVICLKLLMEQGVSPSVVAGHSLGEYSALVGAGVLKFEDALRLVHKRAYFMQEAMPLGKGKMVAVFGLLKEEVELICKEVNGLGVAEPAAFNVSEQIVISGEAKAIDKAVSLARERGANGVLDLAVSIPCHCSLMKEAGERLKIELDKVTLSDPIIPVVGNTTAGFIESGNAAKKELVDQLNNPVLWNDSVQRIVDFGVDTCIELGPGRVLSGLVKRISKELKRLNVEDLASLNRTLSEEATNARNLQNLNVSIRT